MSVPTGTQMSEDDIKKKLDGVTPWNKECIIGDHHLLLSIAVSMKRIADVLDDGLTHLDPKSGGVFGLADIAAEVGKKIGD